MANNNTMELFDKLQSLLLRNEYRYKFPTFKIAIAGEKSPTPQVYVKSLDTGTLEISFLGDNEIVIYNSPPDCFSEVKFVKCQWQTTTGDRGNLTGVTMFSVDDLMSDRGGELLRWIEEIPRLLAEIKRVLVNSGVN